jgi:hypothetical protein
MNSAYKAVALALFATAANAQISNNATLVGKYYFRQVALLTGASASISQTESATGTLTFDGNGNLTVAGMQLVGTAPSANLSGALLGFQPGISERRSRQCPGHQFQTHRQRPGRLCRDHRHRAGQQSRQHSYDANSGVHVL